MTVVYLDASAIVKTLTEEVESGALRTYLEPRSRRVTSRIAAVEVPRALARKRVPPDEADAISAELAALVLLDVTASVAASAAKLEPPSLRSLDAIHLATAMTIGDELEALVTYDGRMANAAALLGLRVVAPR